jgi:hypothetical protein
MKCCLLPAEMKKQADWLVQTLKCTDDEKEIILLAQKQEEKWNEMTDAIKTHLSHDKHYVVNLTGGTKYCRLPFTICLQIRQ